MCPICLGTAAMAGTGSAGGLAALVAMKLHLKRSSGKRLAIREVFPKPNLQPHEAGGGK